MDMLNVSGQDALSERHKTVHRISAHRKIEGLGLDEIWTYRELIFGLLHRDFVAIKNQTSTAWFWRVLRPTFAIITYTILFEQIGKIDFGVGVPYFFMLSAAILPWNLFSAIVIGTTNSIPANASFL
jgi:lipopolysaccharide transport system permease protein